MTTGEVKNMGEKFMFMRKSTKNKKNGNAFETAFEKGLWASRFMILMPVIFSLLGAAVLFLIASYDILNTIGYVWQYFIHHMDIDIHTLVISKIIGAIDIYLIAVILVVFSFGLYELFISKIDDANESESSGILEIHSLDALKDKVAKVIIMALIVKFFQVALSVTKNFSSIMDLVYIALAVAGLALAQFLLSFNSHKK
jgi:uncharacterized protein (TIGR00645 family)